MLPKRTFIHIGILILIFGFLSSTNISIVEASSIPPGETAGALQNRIDNEDRKSYSSNNFAKSSSQEEENSEDIIDDGSAQFMVEQMPFLPPPQFVSTPAPQAQVAQTEIQKPIETKQPESKPGLFDQVWNLFGARNNESDKKEELPAKEKVEAKTDDGSAQLMAESIKPIIPPSQTANIQPQRAFPQVTPQTPQVTKIQPTPKPVADLPKPATPQTPAIAPKSAPYAAAPAAPVQTSPATGAPQKSLYDILPKKQGLYLISPLEDQMWEAAQNLDFEKAIELRDQINKIKQNKDFAEVIRLEKLMNNAAENLEFEKAIEYRDQIRRVQQQIPASVIQPAVPEIKFQVDGFRVIGNEVVDNETLLTYTTHLLDREITLTEVREAAVAIKNHYRELGYIAAYVYIPPQAIEDGYLEFRIIEGEIGSITIRGNKYFKEEVLLNHLRIAPGETVLYNSIKSNLLKLNNHRDIAAKATFKPGQDPKTTDLIVDIEDRHPFHVSVDYNNYGTRLTGEDRFGTTLTHTNLFGNLDELKVRVQGSEGSRAIAADYNTPIYDSDVRVGMAFSRGDVDLFGDFKALSAEGEATNYSVYATMPFWKTDGIETSLRLGYDHKSVENKLLDISTGKDELRVLNAVINIEQEDALGKTFWPHSVHFGIDAFGANQKNQESIIRAGTGAPFFVYRSQFDRFFYLPNDALLQIHSAWQLTPDKLPSSEQFQVGGFNSVRGYPQGEYLGDYGALISGEIAFPVYFLPNNIKLPFEKQTLYDQTRIVGFFDYGTANLKDALPGEASKIDLASAGLGIRMRLYDRVNAQLEWATPLTTEPSDGSEHTLYYGISMDLL